MKSDFSGLGFEINGLLHLNGKQAWECLLNGALLVDVRKDFEIAIKDFAVQEKIICHASDFDNMLLNLPRDRTLILADCVGINSKSCALRLISVGFTKIANLAGGIVDWERDGLPLSETNETMNGFCMCQIKSRHLT